MLKIPQRCTKFHGMCPIRHKNRSIDQSEDVFVEYPVHVIISVAVLAAVIQQRIFLVGFNLLCFTKEYLLSV